VAVLGKGGLSHKTCGLIYDYEAYSFQTFMTSLEIVLAFRGDPVLFFFFFKKNYSQNTVADLLCASVRDVQSEQICRRPPGHRRHLRHYL
jgi:hypothetical protein